jgi:TPR repeat protein
MVSLPPTSKPSKFISKQKLTATLYLTLTILLGSMGMSASADLQKGYTAYKSGDYATVMREWTPLAEQGNADAQYNLGVMYDNGRGVLRDYVRAHMWGNLAASNGDDGKFRDIVSKRMTPADLSTAQKLARECFRKKYKGVE